MSEFKDILTLLFKDKVRIYPYYPYVQVSNKFGNFYISLNNARTYVDKVDKINILCMRISLKFLQSCKYIFMMRNKRYKFTITEGKIIAIIRYLLEEYKNQYLMIDEKYEDTSISHLDITISMIREMRKKPKRRTGIYGIFNNPERR